MRQIPPGSAGAPTIVHSPDTGDRVPCRPVHRTRRRDTDAPMTKRHRLDERTARHRDRSGSPRRVPSCCIGYTCGIPLAFLLDRVAENDRPNAPGGESKARCASVRDIRDRECTAGTRRAPIATRNCARPSCRVDRLPGEQGALVSSSMRAGRGRVRAARPHALAGSSTHGEDPGRFQEVPRRPSHEAQRQVGSHVALHDSRCGRSGGGSLIREPSPRT